MIVDENEVGVSESMLMAFISFKTSWIELFEIKRLKIRKRPRQSVNVRKKVDTKHSRD
jgi:hypothetical protein